MPPEPPRYWDASGVVSVLARDSHSNRAMRIAGRGGAHLLTSLAHAEAVAVLGRGTTSRSTAETQRHVRAVLSEHWVQTAVVPETETVLPLAFMHKLHGADLWHLGAAVALRVELPLLRFVTYDAVLAEAAAAEGFTVEQ